MLYRSFAFSLTVIVALAVGACDTVTDLEEVSVDGMWDGVGALQSETGGVALTLGPESADGTFEGTWRLNGDAYQIRDGSNQGGVIEFTMDNFNGQTVEFSGRLTNRYRLEGEMSGLDLDRPAVFRRWRF